MAAIHFSIEPITLQRKTPFRIAHGTSLERRSVLVHLGSGVGEGAIMPYYGYDQADVVAYLQALDGAELLGDDPSALHDVLDRLPPGPSPARNAVDIALHDHWAQEIGQPLYRLWGLNPRRAPASAVTIVIPESDAELREQVQAVAGFPILKVKLGTGDPTADEQIVRAVRMVSDARIAVDANGAWSVAEAAAIIPRLAAYDLLYIEQPVSHADVNDWERLRALLSARQSTALPPLIADESVHSLEDIFALTAADGINIKLTKAGGLREARHMIDVARALGLKVMLGCAIEGTVGITAAAHLAPLVDFADLDGNLGLLNDPYEGVRMVNGRLLLPDGAGLGVTRKVSNA